MKSGVQVKRDRVKTVSNGLALAVKRDVLVGIPAEKSTRSAGEDLTNAELGYIHDTGAPEANIPERPFLLVGIRDAKPKVTEHLRKGALAFTKGDAANGERHLHAAGIVAVNAVQRRITTGPFEPLKASTIRRRTKRGRSGTSPLIDSGQLRRSITYVLREK